jgi:uncharacterized FlaG/YvyC family protein
MRPADAIVTGPPLAPPPTARGETARAVSAPQAAQATPSASDSRFDLVAAVEKAAVIAFGVREVQVATHHDRDTGRIVVTVTDRHSGETLAQLPPDELLRFYASAAGDLERPLVSIAA